MVVETILICVIVFLVTAIASSVITYFLYPKIAKQVQRTVAELNPTVQKVEAAVETVVADVKKV